MGEEKLKRVVAAATVAAVVFAVILISTVIYQLITISTYKSRKARLENEIYALKQQIAQTNDEITRKSTALYLEQLAREYGFVYKGDVVYDK